MVLKQFFCVCFSLSHFLLLLRMALLKKNAKLTLVPANPTGAPIAVTNEAKETQLIAPVKQGASCLYNQVSQNIY